MQVFAREWRVSHPLSATARLAQSLTIATRHRGNFHRRTQLISARETTAMIAAESSCAQISARGFEMAQRRRGGPTRPATPARALRNFIAKRIGETGHLLYWCERWGSVPLQANALSRRLRRPA